MPTPNRHRLDTWMLEALRLIKSNNGRYRSKDLINDLEKRFDLTDEEKSLNNSGQRRWTTAFRFHSIGLVKAGLVKKEQGFWKLGENTELDFDTITADELGKYCEEKYQEWKERKDVEAGVAGISPHLIEGTFETPLNNLKIDPRKASFDELLKGVDKSLIQIPPFQREFVWSPKDICFLLDSIYRGYPIGSFIFWRTSHQLPRHREIGGLKLNDISSGAQIDYVLDGQQRITSLYAAIRGASIQGDKYTFFFNLTSGKFQAERVRSEVVEESQTRVPLHKLFVESHPEYVRYTAKFPETYQDLMHDLYERFKLYAFSVIYVQEEDESDDEERSESVKKIVNIFSRINEKGVKLTVVAKMVARCWAEEFDIRGKFDELYEKHPDLGEIREETILQAASAILNQRRCRTPDILEATDIRILDQEWENIIESFMLALEFVKTKIRIKNLKYLPFDSLLVPLAYFHYRQRNPSNTQVEQLQVWFWKACLANRFSSAVEGRIEEDCEQFDKILAGEKAEFAYQIDWETFKTRLIAQNYNLRNAFCKTILSLYSYLDPKSFKDGRDIDVKSAFSGYYKNNLHHFFPRAYLEKSRDAEREQRDSIVNIAFAPAIVNIEMSDTAPSNYIAKFREENSALDTILESHLIDDVEKFGIRDNNFGLFLEKRAEKIENEFRILLGLKTKTEQQFEDEPSAPVDLLEAKLRALLQETLIEAFGAAFWDEAVPADIRTAVDAKILSQIKGHPYEREKLAAPEAKMSFLDMMDYEKIMSSNWALFVGIFQSRTELNKHFLAVKNYRNSIKHNRDMNAVERKNGEAAVLWFDALLTKD